MVNKRKVGWPNITNDLCYLNSIDIGLIRIVHLKDEIPVTITRSEVGRSLKQEAINYLYRYWFITSKHFFQNFELDIAPTSVLVQKVTLDFENHFVPRSAWVSSEWNMIFLWADFHTSSFYHNYSLKTALVIELNPSLQDSSKFSWYPYHLETIISCSTWTKRWSSFVNWTNLIHTFPKL